MKIPLVIQPHTGENSIAVIATMLSYYGCHKPIAQLRPFNITSRGGSSPAQMQEMASQVGLQTEIREADLDELKRMGARRFRADFIWRDYAPTTVLRTWRDLRQDREVADSWTASMFR